MNVLDPDERWVLETLWATEQPEPDLTVSEWADAHRILSTEASAEAGQWRTDRTPYLREIMDAISPSCPVTHIVIEKAAQLGFTECLNNLIGFIIDLAPGPTLVVQPTESTIKRNVEQRIEPMILSSPRLRTKVGDMKSREKGNRILQKTFPGGLLVFIGANAPSPLRSMPARYALLDEVDGYPHDVKGEGHPCELAIKRTKTYTNAKVVEGSTPVNKETSRIHKQFILSDQRYYHVPCPLCGAKQVLEMENLHWESGDPSTAHFECVACHQAIYEAQHKTGMLAGGEWIPTNPGAEIRGYHLAAFYAPYRLGPSWESIVRDFLDSKNDVGKLKAFVNTVLGEPWEERGDVPPWQWFFDKARERFDGHVPERAIVLTGGIDVQQDRLELQIVGWNKDLAERWIYLHETIEGSPLDEAPWAKLDAVLERKYPHALGGEIGVLRWAIDTGFLTQEVYRWARKHDRIVCPIKGMDRADYIIGSASTVEVTARDGRRLSRRGLRVWPISSSRLKEDLFERLGAQYVDRDQADAPEYIHLNDALDQRFVQGLLSEARRTVKRHGYERREWIKIVERNEPLDCHNYAHAAALISAIQRWPESEWAKARALCEAPRDERPRAQSAGPRVTARIKMPWDD